MILLSSILSVPGLLVVITFGAILFAFIAFYNDSSRRRNRYDDEDYDYYDAYQPYHRNRPSIYYPPYPTPYQPPQWMPPPRQGYSYDPYREPYNRRELTMPWGVFFVAFMIIMIVMTFIVSQNNNDKNTGKLDEAEIGINLDHEPKQVPDNNPLRSDYIEIRNTDNTKSLVNQSFDWHIGFTVQAGYFESELYAEDYKAILQEAFNYKFPVEILTIVNENGQAIAYRAFIGHFDTRAAAITFARELSFYSLEAGIPVDLSEITYRME